MTPRIALIAALSALAIVPRVARATEICGNDIDDDSNGMTDEGCAPSITTGVCESPLSCGDTGMVSWSTGALHYDLPPDANPHVPYGPGIGLRRFYTSMYAPGTGPSSVNHTPMGARWQHTYMSWIDRVQVASVWRVILHTSEGRDVFATYSTTVSGWETYTPQAGFHVMSIKRNTASPNQYQIQLLTGETLVYNSFGQLSEVWDSLPSPNTNKVLITWTSNTSGNVSTVTDAAGARRLLFNYTSNLLTSVNYQVKVSGTWTTEQTTTYAYTSGTLTSVNIGPSLTQQYAYTSSYLTSITDATGNLIAGFTYDSTTAGKVVRVDTPKGMVGLEYNTARSTNGCAAGNTVLYFNRAATTSCSADTDCGTGYLCGGKTGTGSTGTCFYAGRCMTLSTASTIESVVTTVSPLGHSSSACTGACTDVAQYVWSTGAGLLNVIGMKDPLTPANYTSATYNSNGLPTQITYGDSDSDPTTVPTGGRTSWITYDTVYPGRVAEVRRPSDLNESASSCSPSNPTPCARTSYTYGTDTTLQSFTQSGYTRDSTGAVIPFSYATSYVHDTKGRLTEVDGPTTGMKTVFDYFTSTDLTRDGYLQDYKLYKDSTNHLDTTILTYDIWGNATGRKDPDTTVSCRTFDTNRNYMTQTREAMAGQADCTTTDAADITTSWLRDSALRLTQLTKPDGSCVISAYDTRGRLLTVKRRDDCNAASSGDYQQYVYNTEGLLTELDTYDASSTLTAKKPYTYYDSRRLAGIANPVTSPTAYKTLIYDARGLVQEVDDESSLGKTTYAINADSRITAESHYNTGSTYDTWTIQYDWLGDQSQYTDGDSKTTISIRDDLGRYVALESPDASTYIQKVFDPAGNLTTQTEVAVTGVTATHSFTYDYIGRQLNADYYGSCRTGTPHPEIQRIYDTMPSGLTCPITGGCNNIVGRLSYVKVSLMCSSAYADDGSLDQETFYSYDAAGRVIDEYIRDDSGRIANHQYGWNKDGALSRITTPSGAVFGWTYGSSPSNSDSDRVSAVWQTSIATPVIDTISWFSFGPLKNYAQKNSIGGTALQTTATRNLAYRLTDLRMQTQSTPGTEKEGLALSEDAKGRVTLRNYFDNSTGVRDSYYLYDEQDRVLCETSTSVASCPTGGANIKNSHDASPPFTSAGDWKAVVRANEGTVGPNTFSLNTGTHQIASVDQGASLGTVSYTYNSVGSRTSDASSGANETHTGRTYTYDGRHNVINVRGQYPTWDCSPFGICPIWDYYDDASSFDANGRRATKVSWDETSGLTRNYFYYYDPLGRLTEIRYVPDVTDAGTYSLYEIVWLGHRPVAYIQSDYPGPTVSKRYTVTDETDRVIAMWSWPASGDATRVWAIDPDAWGEDATVVGSSMLQPLVFAGQYQDWETYTYSDFSGTMHEYALNLNGARTYDPFVGAYLQTDPLVDATRSSYVYVDGDPVGRSDPDGRKGSNPWGTSTETIQITGEVSTCWDVDCGFPASPPQPPGPPLSGNVLCYIFPILCGGNMSNGGGSTTNPATTTFADRQCGSMCQNCFSVAMQACTDPISHAPPIDGGKPNSQIGNLYCGQLLVRYYTTLKNDCIRDCESKYGANAMGTSCGFDMFGDLAGITDGPFSI